MKKDSMKHSLKYFLKLFEEMVLNTCHCLLAYPNGQTETISVFLHSEIKNNYFNSLTFFVVFSIEV